MGTRALVHILDDHSEAVLATIYVQFDGYPSGLGADLKEFLSGRALVNGFGSDTPAKASNGMGCLAASLIQQLKDGIGGVYLVAPGSSDHWEEYVYTISGAGGRLSIRAEDVSGVKRRTLYSGAPEEFDTERRYE